MRSRENSGQINSRRRRRSLTKTTGDSPQPLSSPARRPPERFMPADPSRTGRRTLLGKQTRAPGPSCEQVAACKQERCSCRDLEPLQRRKPHLLTPARWADTSPSGHSVHPGGSVPASLSPSLAPSLLYLQPLGRVSALMGSLKVAWWGRCPVRRPLGRPAAAARRQMPGRLIGPD